MKRSEMIQLIMDTFEFQGRGTQMREKDADSILDAIEKAGMLPPVNTCRFVEDTNRGGTKHSPAKREWDNEDTISQNK